MGRSFLLFSTLVVPLLAGCATTRFVVIDATTQEPLQNVQVDGYRFQQRQYQPSDFAWSAVEIAPTGEAGTTSSINVLSVMPAENRFRYVFNKAGYQPAEALVYRDKTLVASPAIAAGWKLIAGKRGAADEIVPTENFETVPAGEKILVQLYPTTAPSTTAPAP